MSTKQLLESETSHEQARVLLQVSQGKLAAAEEGLKEAEAALAESDAQAQKQWIEELSKASSELIEVQESLKKYADRVERLIIRAPTRGRVQQLLQRSRGEVVRPGDAVAKIVPLGDALVAEVLVKPEDIAAVKEGDKAELKVTAYDFSKYGKIKGEVSDISPTTFEQDDKRYYYKCQSLRSIRRGLAAAAGNDGRCRYHLGEQVIAAVFAEADLSRGRCGLL